MVTVIEVPAPTRWINANDRSHWARRARLTKLWRNMTAARAREVHNGPPLPGLVRIECRVHKTTNRPYDIENLSLTGKACVDGLRDAGVIAEDTIKHVAGVDMRDGGKRPAAGVTIIIEPAGGE